MGLRMTGLLSTLRCTISEHGDRDKCYGFFKSVSKKTKFPIFHNKKTNYGDEKVGNNFVSNSVKTLSPHEVREVQI